jgi:hypothetical protein
MSSVAPHRAEETTGVVDHHQIEGLVLDGQLSGRRDFHVDEHARLRRAFPRARG